MKQRLPKNVCEAIKRTWNKYENNAHPKHIVMTNWRYLENIADFQDLCTIREFATKKPIEYMTSLVNDFEPIEEDITVTITPEQQRDLENRYSVYQGSEDRFYQGVAMGIREFASVINIKIKGVNQ